MAPKGKAGGRRVGRAFARGGVRAFRSDDVNSQIEQRLCMLGLRTEGPRAGSTDTRIESRLARALRRERRAARAGGPGYDPVRHLVLARLDRQLRRKRK
jgi:hypothetical protein